MQAYTDIMPPDREKPPSVDDLKRLQDEQSNEGILLLRHVCTLDTKSTVTAQGN